MHVDDAIDEAQFNYGIEVKNIGLEPIFLPVLYNIAYFHPCT